MSVAYKKYNCLQKLRQKLRQKLLQKLLQNLISTPHTDT